MDDSRFSPGNNYYYPRNRNCNNGNRMNTSRGRIFHNTWRPHGYRGDGSWNFRAPAPNSFIPPPYRFGYAMPQNSYMYGNIMPPAEFNAEIRNYGYNYQPRHQQPFQQGQLPSRSHNHPRNDLENNAASSSSSSSASARNNHFARTRTDSIYSDKSYDSVKENDGTQRERLTEELRRGVCDCIICFERIRQNDRVWNCIECYQVFHLSCLRKWANSSEQSEGDWRCPGCQHVFHEKPSRYLCFCGKQENPEWSRGDSWKTPHSCGEPCLRIKQNSNCSHPCTLLCHPGSCPPCLTYVTRPCFCGKTKKQMRCNEDETFCCENICDKTLSCGFHTCQLTCHDVTDHICYRKYTMTCFCGCNQREVSCSGDSLKIDNYCCGDVCNKLLKCNSHYCSLICHLEECPPCPRNPELIKYCPCGKTQLSEIENFSLRKNCSDPIPTCDSICGKGLQCGSKDEPHTCQELCHDGPCPPCSLVSYIRCQCGRRNEKVQCKELTNESIVKCKKRCNKMKSCGRHRCTQNCCTEVLHKCDLVCGQKLSCNLHQCNRPCHLGNCSLCENTSFDELSCHCGATVMYPPIPCGTLPPDCPEPCQRRPNCEHAPQHRCHSEPECPPCTVLTSKWCFGDHELRTCIPCYQKDVCCGLPCKKLLPCGRHFCTRICHPSSCAVEPNCSQSCNAPRLDCGHPCGLPCHEGECTPSTCKSMVTVTCRCGRRSGAICCAENLSVYNRMVALELSGIISDEKVQRTRTLECDAECALTERNRRLALALQIKNPDITNKLRPPVYSEFLKDQTKKSPEVVTEIYQQLSNLVQSAKDSKQSCRSYAFPTMKSDHRRIVHELAEFFGCETQSYDREPKKNVVATAYKNKSWLPSASLMSVVEKETRCTSRLAGKAPPPVPHCSYRREINSSPNGEETK